MSLTDAAEERFPTLRKLHRAQRRRRLIKLVAWIDEEIEAGNRSADDITDRVLFRARGDDDFGISPILIAVIAELVAWLVRRILDRFFPREGNASGGTT